MTNEIRLKVAESSSQRAVGKGIARLDPNVMNELKLMDGDLIELNGTKKTAAIVLPSQNDINTGIIRIDGMTRKNSGASIGGEVLIKKTDIMCLINNEFINSFLIM